MLLKEQNPAPMKRQPEVKGDAVRYIFIIQFKAAYFCLPVKRLRCNNCRCEVNCHKTPVC